MTTDRLSPADEALLRAAYAALPKPANPGTAMHEYEIRFTYSVTVPAGNRVTSSEKHRLKASSSADATRQFHAWFNDAYQGATLHSTTVFQVP